MASSQAKFGAGLNSEEWDQLTLLVNKMNEKEINELMETLGQKLSTTISYAKPQNLEEALTHLLCANTEELDSEDSRKTYIELIADVLDKFNNEFKKEDVGIFKNKFEKQIYCHKDSLKLIVQKCVEEREETKLGIATLEKMEAIHLKLFQEQTSYYSSFSKLRRYAGVAVSLLPGVTQKAEKKKEEEAPKSTLEP